MPHDPHTMAMVPYQPPPMTPMQQATVVARKRMRSDDDETAHLMPYARRMKLDMDPRFGGAVSQHMMLASAALESPIAACVALVQPYFKTIKIAREPSNFSVAGTATVEHLVGDLDDDDEEHTMMVPGGDHRSASSSSSASKLPVPIINFYDHVPPNVAVPQYRNPNYPYAPRHPFRVCILGPTGSGKTNILLNLVKNCGNFDYIHGLVETPGEILYETGRAIFGPNRFIVSNKWDECIPDMSRIPDNSPLQRLVFFDDKAVADTQTKNRMKKFIEICRKKNISFAILSHQWFGSTLKFLRDNCNLLFIKSVSNMDELHEILRTKNVMGIDKDVLEDMYHEAVDAGHFLNMTLDKTCEPGQRARIGFNLNTKNLQPKRDNSNGSNSGRGRGGKKRSRSTARTTSSSSSYRGGPIIEEVPDDEDDGSSSSSDDDEEQRKRIRIMSLDPFTAMLERRFPPPPPPPPTRKRARSTSRRGRAPAATKRRRKAPAAMMPYHRPRPLLIGYT